MALSITEKSPKEIRLNTTKVKEIWLNGKLIWKAITDDQHIVAGTVQGEAK